MMYLALTNGLDQQVKLILIKGHLDPSAAVSAGCIDRGRAYIIAQGPIRTEFEAFAGAL
jgi:hypothetical protein